MQHLDEGTIHAWLDEALPPDETTRVATHVAECETCAQAVAEARGFIAASSRILSALDEVPAGVIPSRDTAVPRDALAALRARRAREREAARRRWWSSPRAVAAASVTFLAVASGSILLRSAYGPQPSAGAAERAAVSSAETVTPGSGPASGAANRPSTPAGGGGVESPDAPPSVAHGAEPAAPSPAPPPSPTGALRSMADRAETKLSAESDTQRQMAKAEDARPDSLGNPQVAGDPARRARAEEPPRIAAIQQQGLDPRTQQRRTLAPPSPLQPSAAARTAPTAPPAEADSTAARSLVQELAGCYRLTPVTGVAQPYALPSELSLDTAVVVVTGDSSWRRAVPLRSAPAEFAWRPRNETTVELVMHRDAGTAPRPVSVAIRASADSPRQAQDESVVATLVRVACAR